MVDKEIPESRPFWKIRRLIGTVILTLGAGILAAPAVTLTTVLWIPVTTKVVGVILTTAGSFVGGYGYGAKVEREKK